jgi:hypothetical protein
MNPILSRAVEPRYRREAIAERILPSDLRRGRGAATNASGRFELENREDFGDG